MARVYQGKSVARKEKQREGKKWNREMLGKRKNIKS